MSPIFNYPSYLFYFDLLGFSLLLLPCYYALRSAQTRRLLLFCAGLYLVYFIAPRLALFYLLFWNLVFFIHRFAFPEEGDAQSGGHSRRGLPMLLALSALPCLVLPLVFWKTMEGDFVAAWSNLANGALHALSNRLWQIDLCKPLLAPIGLSFSTFRAIDLLIKTSLGRITRLSWDEVMFYGFFPPVQVVGPIIEYEEIANQEARPEAAGILEGLLRIGAGFIKVFAFAALLEGNARIFTAPRGLHAGELWLRLVGFSWYFYLNFAGYSDMAIGTARLYGFRLKENFDFPYFSPNIRSFWNSWHMSLSRWAQRNVFVPCGGYRAQTQNAALFLTMLAIALWHNISLSMAVFALVQFAVLVLQRRGGQTVGLAPATKYSPAAEKYSPAAEPRRTWETAGYTLLTYTTILLCLPLLFLKLPDALRFYGALAGVAP